ncbi:type I polyketide synthase [Streptomyces sp. NPDC055607]
MENHPKDPVAIIGIGCRFPGSQGPRDFWDSISNGVDSITEIPRDRFDADEFYSEEPATRGKMMSRWGGFIPGVDKFDADFFGISPREAARMDPQHRVLMEVAWEAVEDAGIPLDVIGRHTAGVFMGLISADYWDLQFGSPHDLDVYSTTGSARSGTAGRVSHALGLRGLSVALDAACSSSLVAVHLACQSLRTGSCDVALAGGVNVILNPDHCIGFSQGRMMAPDGRCKTFDARANGYVRSEGAGVLVLKPLSAALADGDTVYAVIDGSAANNDGPSDLFMQPSVDGQAEVLRMAYRDAGIAPADVQYVEAHGTGTPAGDPVELKALGSVLGEGRPVDAPLLVGSVKTNIGHLEGAAGLAGIIKVALSLKHGLVPPNLHFETPSPAIPWDDLPVRVPTRLEPWPEAARRTAGVSSFGIAGTNAHIVLSAPPAASPEETRPAPSTSVLTLSARSEEALREVAARHASALSGDAPDLRDVLHTLARRRTHHEYRLGLATDSVEEAGELLDAFAGGEEDERLVSGRADGEDHRSVWVFPGQGAQWAGMGADLLDEAAFEQALRACDDVMNPLLGWSVLERIRLGTEATEVDQVQPLSFALNVSLAALWRSWGVTPDAVIGHSQGEIAAAYVAGALTLEDAALIVCKRSRLLRSIMGEGAMAVVGAAAESVADTLSRYEGQVVVAAHNGPDSTVIAGDADSVEQAIAEFDAEGVFAQLVRVDYASHSHHIDVLEDDLAELLAPVAPRRAEIPFYSTTADEVFGGEELDGRYWIRNLRQPVLFRQAVERAARDGFDSFLEVSAHPLLVQPIRKSLSFLPEPPLVAGSLRRDEPGRAALADTLAAWHVEGRAVDWSGSHLAEGETVALPAYPWQGERHWNPAADRNLIVDGRRASGPAPDSGAHPILGDPVPLAGSPGVLVWHRPISRRSPAYLADHRVSGVTLFPAAGFVELFLAAAAQAKGADAEQAVEITDVRFSNPLFLPEGETRTVQVTATSVDDGTIELECHVREDSDATAPQWTLLAAARSTRFAPGEASDLYLPEHPSSAREISAEELYSGIRARGIEHDGVFRTITGPVSVSSRSTVATIDTAPWPELSVPGYRIHPALADCFLQAMMALLPDSGDTYLPVGIDRVVHQPGPRGPGSVLEARAARRGPAEETDRVTCDLRLGEDDLVRMSVEGLCLQRLEEVTSGSGSHRTAGELVHVPRWEALPLLPGASHASQHWVVLHDGSPVAEGIRRAARTQGRPCTFVGARGQDPASWADATRSALQVACAGLVVVLPPATDVVESLTSTGIALSVLQELAARKTDAAPRVWFVSHGAQHVVQDDTALSAQHAAVWGMVRTASYELPELRCSMADLSLRPGEREFDGLWREVGADADENEVALRGLSRFARRLVPHPLPADDWRPSFRPDASYLVTGGLGGVGLRTARWLVENGARHLVLVGRRDPGSEASAQLDALRAEGAEVHAVSADVADGERMREVFGWIDRDLPPLRGVVHSAVVIEDRTITQLEPRHLKSVLPPKVHGTHVLHELTRGLPLDFFVLYSSAAATMGSPGQANYAAANAFMDAYAWNRRLAGLPGLTVNWGRWGEIGLAARDVAAGKRMTARGLAPMDPEDALGVLGRLMADCSPQATVMSLKVDQWVGFFSSQERSSVFRRMLRDGAPAPAVATAPAPAPAKDLPAAGADRQETHRPPEREGTPRARVLGAAASDRADVLTDYLRDSLAMVLGTSGAKVRTDAPIRRLGVDSLMCVELTTRIKADLGITVPVVKLLQGASVRGLASDLADTVAGTGGNE